VEGRAADKWSPDEGEVVLALLRRLRDKALPFDCYVLSPFRVVADRMSATILRSGVLTGLVAEPEKWCRERVGTVHTAQGREDRAVILVLGAPLPEQAGARSWAGGRPNLLNVAVTRAKEAVYVVGSRRVWRSAGVFAALAERLEEGSIAAIRDRA
jgi:superfamily I DNA/RNA helicase